jgi:hypothetical protein
MLFAAQIIENEKETRGVEAAAKTLEDQNAMLKYRLASLQVEKGADSSTAPVSTKSDFICRITSGECLIAGILGAKK